MRDLLAKLNIQRILLVLAVVVVSAGSGFLVGMWLGG